MSEHSTRRPIVVGNWKMHKTAHEARSLVRELRSLPMPDGVEVVVAPPFTALFAVHEELAGSKMGLGAQTMAAEAHGAHTGDISAPMLLELGVKYVILGHSERRKAYYESDASVNRRVRVALAHGLTPVVAVGETAEERAQDMSIERVVSQTRLAFTDVSEHDVARCVVAYEPIWAIGTGQNDSPNSANAVIAEIRGAVPGLANARLLYGGSMKPENAASLLEQPHIDGGLIGGASLSAIAFAAIVEAAQARVRP